MTLQNKKQLEVEDAAALLQPGSVLLLGTCQPDGRPNVMALAWYTLQEHQPLRIACVVRNDRQSHAAMAEQKECVLNVPSLEQLEQVLACGTLSAREIDKLATLGWTTAPASRVRVPLVQESSAHIECRVVDQHEMGDCSVFVLEPLAVWLDNEAEMPDFHAAPGSLLLRSREEIDRRKEELRNVIEMTTRRPSSDPVVRGLFS